MVMLLCQVNRLYFVLSLSLNGMLQNKKRNMEA